MAVMVGRKAAIYLAKFPSTTMTAEATTANGARTEFRITNRAKRFIDPTATTTVYYSGSPVTTYSEIQYPAGIVTWAVSPGASAVTVTGKYLTVAALTQCKEWELSFDSVDVDTTFFQDAAKGYTRVMVGASVTLNRFIDDTVKQEIFTQALSGNARVGIDLFTDFTGSAEDHFALYGNIANDGVSASVDGVLEEAVTLNISGKFYAVSLL